MEEWCLNVTRGDYHLKEKSGWVVESMMVSDLPIYRTIATSVAVWMQKRANLCVAWVWNRDGTEKLINGKQHSVWFVPTEMNGLPQNVLLNFRLEFSKIEFTIYLSSGISEIFCQMVSSPEINQEVHSVPPAPGFRFDARSRVPLIFSNRSLVALECITWIAGLSKPWLGKTKEQLRQISKVIIFLNRLNPAWSGRSQETE